MRFYLPHYSSGDLRWPHLSLHVFTSRGARPTTSGGSIFLLVKKDRGERHAKGLQSRPLESGFYTGVWRGDVLASYEFAQMQLTRFRPVRGVLRTASTDSRVLLALRRKRWHLINYRPNLWSKVGWLRKFCNHYGQRSTQRQGNKRSAAADLIASHAPLRGGTTKVRPVSSKTLTPGDSRGRQQGPRQSPTSVGLVGRGGATE